MKILESRPSRYDRGINLLTLGHAGRIKTTIADRWVKPGMRVIDIGCGTGEFVAYSAGRGAEVTGVDISGEMLERARRRLKEKGLEEKTRLYRAGIPELDGLVEGGRFDLVVSTLVLSELYRAEREWFYREAARILKKSGRLILAAEVRPKSLLTRMIYHLVRFPFALITTIMAHTGTRAVSDMTGEVSRAGFEVLGEQRSLIGSFSLVWARKNPKWDAKAAYGHSVSDSGEDVSVAKTLWDYVGRWFPSPVEPGLRKINTPDEDSPLFVTGNFHLTVRRVERTLSEVDAWLLVAPSNGINVWCASCGGEFSTLDVVNIFKMSSVTHIISRREVILPQLCAPGIDVQKLEKETGFKPVFGPVYAEDIPDFLSRGMRKTPFMCLARFPFLFRLEMLVSMNALVWVAFALILLVMNPSLCALFTLLFWGAGCVLYGAYPWIPGNSGWLKGLGLGVLIVMGIGIATAFAHDGSWFSHWGWMLSAVIISLWLGFDLRGIVEGSPSEATPLLEKLGIKTIGKFYSSRKKTKGAIRQDTSRCTGCQTCTAVCPKGVFIVSSDTLRPFALYPGSCFACNACVFQCPENALEIL